MKYATYMMFTLFLTLAGAFAQNDQPDERNPAFTRQELDQMLAPIALYPDSLLSQILMAATYPLEVVEAARWSHDNPKLSGDAAVQAVDSKDWDPSVKSLVAFPQVLQTMDRKIEWTERLGDAFLAQQAQVMDTVQNLRHKAQAAGNLRPNAQIGVQEEGDDLEIVPSNPEVVYVPYYDPTVVYGPWWWPEYPPVYWGPWAGYYWNGGFAWGFGIGVGVDFFFGGWDWSHHRAFVHDHRHRFPHGDGGRNPWHHDPGHRHGAPYRDDNLNRRFVRGGISVDRSGQYRGRETPVVPPGTGPGRPIPGQVRPELNVPRRAPAPIFEPRPHAFEGVGRGPAVRDFSARGRASFPNPAPRPAPRPAPPPPQHGH